MAAAGLVVVPVLAAEEGFWGIGEVRGGLWGVMD